jgi:hypothetical protein
VTQATSTDTFAGKVAFHLGLSAVLTCSSELRGISTGIRTAIGLSEHWIWGSWEEAITPGSKMECFKGGETLGSRQGKGMEGNEESKSRVDCQYGTAPMRQTLFNPLNRYLYIYTFIQLTQASKGKCHSGTWLIERCTEAAYRGQPL